ncbi:flagellar basal body-associated FliL family protein [Marivita sp.]|uniref:flagellar basal body-associated FliL family protein n=1 Tax=Marivita sp. TaxID=2003365 RepID=UPI0025B9D8E4|nr:flagellar basal body-associated FliL family protein [Marivita sp.]
MSSVTALPEAPASRGRIVLILGVALVFLVGVGAGISFGMVFGDDTASEDPPHAATEERDAPARDRQEVEVGRITVVIPADRAGGGRLHLLIAPLVVAYPDAVADDHDTGETTPAPTAELRDAFIEYLSQLRESDVRGSAGFALLREELLRRARAVAPELNAKAVLIQDLVIQ